MEVHQTPTDLAIIQELEELEEEVTPHKLSNGKLKFISHKRSSIQNHVIESRSSTKKRRRKSPSTNQALLHIQWVKNGKINNT